MLVFFALCLPFSVAFRCIHDSAGLSQRRPQQSSALLAPPHARRLAEASDAVAPIRIAVRFLNSTAGALGTPAAAYLQSALLPAAVRRWEGLLRVRPVAGPLRVGRACLSGYAWPNGSFAGCAAFAAPPSCSLGSAADVPVPLDAVGADSVIDATGAVAQTLPALGPGLAGADYLLLATVESYANCGQGNTLASGESILAFASVCISDAASDRPLVGRINFCPAALDASPAAWPLQLGVALHEMAHALGFSASQWPLMREWDTLAPRTPRDAFSGAPRAAFTITRTCNGASLSTHLPSARTVQYFGERGAAACGWNASGVAAASRLPLSPAVTPLLPAAACVARLVTPAAAAAAAAHFACPGLAGAELENQLDGLFDGDPCSPIQGSHWEQRVLDTELMSSYREHVMLLSNITLAALEDTGWYKVDYSGADVWRKNYDYGFNQGCAFATGSCSASNAGSPPHFAFIAPPAPPATDNATITCTTDRRAIGMARVLPAPPPQRTLYAQYAYWPGSAAVGDGPITADYCPVIRALAGWQCAAALPAGQAASAAALGWAMGGGGGGGAGAGAAATNMCLESSLLADGYAAGSAWPVGCFAVACAAAPGAAAPVLLVTIPSSPSLSFLRGNTTLICASAGQAAGGVAGFSGSIACPDPAVYCGGAAPAVAWSAYPSGSATPSVTPSGAPTPSLSPSAPALVLAPAGSTSAAASEGTGALSLAVLLPVLGAVLGGAGLLVAGCAAKAAWQRARRGRVAPAAQSE